jgi:uncharacterized cupin superfamily protein
MTDGPFALERFPVHLGLGAIARVLPEIDGTIDWYARYGRDTEADGVEGRLVSMHTFDAPWDSWEMHPQGYELVVCTAGTITLHQEIGNELRTVTLHAGDAAINPPGAWHTADVESPATALFVTAGVGTQNRAR